MSVGTYEEPVGGGGTLKVSKSSWEISYYFSGPDLRYNGEFVVVPGDLIEEYISAFAENLQEYEKIKISIPKGGEFSKVGKLGMTIHVGKFPNGVCLKSYHLPISSSQQLDHLAGIFRYAKQRASQVQEFLATL